MTNSCVIIGGGSSIRQGKWLIPVRYIDLWYKLKDKFTIGTNFSGHFFDSTILMYNDYQFYHTNTHMIKSHKLVLGREDGAYRRKNGVKLEDNTVLLKECERCKKIIWNHVEPGMHPHYWGKDAWTKGFYCSQMISLKALNLAIALNCDEIYLLGLDATDIDGYTHFYEDTGIGSYTYESNTYCGVGKEENGKFKTGNFNKIDELNNYWYEPFKQEIKNGINIYNVSPFSKINVFPKITYDEFYKRLPQIDNVDHEEIRNKIKEKLK